VARERVVKVAVVGDASQLKREMAAAEAQLNGFGVAAKKMSTRLSTEFLAVGAGATLALGMVAKTTMNFDAQMSNVGAVAGATSEQLETLRDAALEAGAATVFSASDAAEAQAELAKAGVSTQDILSGGLMGALDLASAGNLELGQAAIFAANAMTTFKLSGADVPRIADALAAGANKSAANVDDMGMALQQSGLVADQMGLSLEDTVGVLSMFAQAGLKGSDAGTSLKTALMRLTPSSDEAAAAMADLGLNFYDARGQFVGISEASEMLKDKLEPLTQEQRNLALQTIFGTDAIRAATVLYEGGADGVDRWVSAVSEAGYASQLAADKTDNLAGDLEALKGSLETALIESGSKATDVLRGMAQGITGVVNGFGEMPAPLQVAGIGFTGLVATGGLLIGAYGKLAPMVDNMKASLEGMGSAGQFAARNMGLIGAAAGGVTIALVGIAAIYGDVAKRQAEIEEGAREYAAAIRDQTGALQENIDAVTARKFAEGDLGDVLRDSGADYRVLAQGIAENESALDGWADTLRLGTAAPAVLGKSLRDAAAGGNEFAGELLRLQGTLSEADFFTLVKQLELVSTQYSDGVNNSEAYDQALEGLGISADGAAGATGGLAAQTAELAGAMGDTEKKTREALKAIEDFFGGVTDALSSSIDFEEAIDDLAVSLFQNGREWDIATEAGRENTQALIAAKDAAIEHGIAVFEQTGSTQAATEAAMGHVDALAETMRQAGLTDEQIFLLLHQMGLTPENIATQFNTPGLAEAQAAAETFKGLLDTIPGQYNAIINADTSTAEEKIRGLDRLITDSFTRSESAGIEALNLALGTDRSVLDGARAFGGPVAAGGAYLVGERGPEVFRPSQDGQIDPSGAMPAGGPTFNITTTADPNAIATATRREWRRQSYLVGMR
jgi:TP901 family phage tail tape measure protein